MTDEQKENEKKIFKILYKVENELDDLVKKMYQNRLDKHDLVLQLHNIQNPNLDETQKRIQTKQKKNKQPQNQDLPSK